MPYAEASELTALPGPFEIFEPSPGVPTTIRPTAWQLGKAKIAPRDGRPPYEVSVLRVTVPTKDKVTLPQYWDITSKHLIAGLLGYLEAPAGGPYDFIITKSGTGPTARFVLEARPRAK